MIEIVSTIQEFENQNNFQELEVQNISHMTQAPFALKVTKIYTFNLYNNL